MNADWRTDDTKEIPLPTARASTKWPDTGSARVRVDFGGATHQGNIRRANQDHYLILRGCRSLETVQSSLPEELVPLQEEEVGFGLLVADGMGGTTGGEIASRVALSTLISLVLRTHGWLFSDDSETATEVMRRFSQRFRLIHEVLRDQAREDPDLRNMGTTLTLAVSLGHSLVVGHIGDSRAYLLRDGKLFQLTRDHTVIQPLVDAGTLSQDEADRHPSRHILTACLGGGGPPSQGDFQQATLLEGDQLLLCTDGLSEHVRSPTIIETLQSHVTAQDACNDLVSLALDAGGSDNVTVVLARYRFFD